MPVVLPHASFNDWLNPNLRSPQDIAAVLSCALDEFSHYPVSPALTGASHDDEAFVRPVPLESTA
jgi:putative SOS response-associated peptidase YedK